MTSYMKYHQFCTSEMIIGQGRLFEIRIDQ